ncbi:MAG TPA: LLM class flavin-dependent oxidoreductase [Candidatus Binataceae bacterium]|nr:LLM class flavin-dependent oxidoreductase [Candidatus Binataceae bacterium]
MRFGLFYQLPCAPDQSEPVRYNETVEQLVLADQLGFDVGWLAELHFFRPFSIMPAPLYVAVAAAQRTRQIRFGTGVTLLPFHHPLRIAEEVAVADILTGGRIDFGVGRGTIALHFQGFEVDREESRPRFEEILGIIRKAWTNERFAHRSAHYDIPETAVVPKPLQKPHPPIRVAANSPETAEFAGLHNLDVMVASPINPMPGFFDHVRRYRDALARAGHAAGARDVAALFFTNTGESSAAVRAEFEPSMMHYFRTIGEQARLGDRSQYEGSYQYLRQVRERVAAMTWEGVERSMGAFGPPEECIRRIDEIYDGAHINQLVCWFNPGGRIPHRDVMAAMERFAAKVIPTVRPLGETTGR